MRRMTLLPALALSLLPFVALAAGDDDTEPPKPTATTTECEQGLVYDQKTKTCVAPVEGSLDDDQLFGAARELAYAGRYPEALAALAAMSDQGDDRILTYLGFIHRKSGDVELGMEYYAQALEQNPANILARSYMGQGLVEQGELTLARAELDRIVALGGSGTWAEQSLRRAVETGVTYSY